MTLEIAVAIAILVGIYYLFAPEEELDLPPLQQQEIDPIIRAQIDASQGEPVAASPAEATAADANKTETPDGEAAREIIDECRALVAPGATEHESDPGRRPAGAEPASAAAASTARTDGSAAPGTDGAH